MYDPYSKGLKCKWCDVAVMDSFADHQCDRCWEVLMRLPDAMKISKLSNEIKRLVNET